tara:strand:- start:439 stop:852 length:414 start_codon:yes stop_codon:yes gene_type:complete
MSITKNINLKKTVFNKTKFNETINTDFTQLVDVVDPSFFDLNLATLDDFWTLYEKLFYIIPKEGDINSHAYLAQTSGDYADYTPQQDEIESLLEEIAELREENLEVRQNLATVLTTTAATIANLNPASGSVSNTTNP